MEGPLIQSASAERNLISRAAEGDLDAFNLLVTRWEKRIYNYLLRATRNREDALDLCQDVFLKAFRGLGSLADADRFPSWLFRIAHNEVVSSARRAKRAPGGRPPAPLREHSGVPRSRLGEFGCAGPEMAYLVEQAMDSLRPRHREAVLLKLHYGFKFREIAEILDCPVSTVKSRVYSALDSLRHLLEPLPAGHSSREGR